MLETPLQSREAKRRPPRFVRDIQYGPFSYVLSIAIGFVIGTMAFLIGDATVDSAVAANASAQMPILLACAGGGTLVSVCVTTIANLVVGAAIRNGLEMQRQAFSGAAMPPPPFDDAGEELRRFSNAPANSNACEQQIASQDCATTEVSATHVVSNRYRRCL